MFKSKRPFSSRPVTRQKVDAREANHVATTCYRTACRSIQLALRNADNAMMFPILCKDVDKAIKATLPHESNLDSETADLRILLHTLKVTLAFERFNYEYMNTYNQNVKNKVPEYQAGCEALLMALPHLHGINITAKKVKDDQLFYFMQGLLDTMNMLTPLPIDIIEHPTDDVKQTLLQALWLKLYTKINIPSSPRACAITDDCAAIINSTDPNLDLLLENSHLINDRYHDVLHKTPSPMSSKPEADLLHLIAEMIRQCEQATSHVSRPGLPRPGL